MRRLLPWIARGPLTANHTDSATSWGSVRRWWARLACILEGSFLDLVSKCVNSRFVFGCPDHRFPIQSHHPHGGIEEE